MEKGKAQFSMRKTILLLFITALLMSVAFFGIVVFANWVNSAKTITEHLASDINEEIYEQVSSFIHMPYHVNEISHKVIERGMLDLSDEKQRDRFFVEILKANGHEIYSFSYGTASGEYYGARRNENDVMEIMRNNASTGGNSWYYSVNQDLTAGKLSVQTGPFDPRTRSWYKAAAENGVPMFSPIYRHFVMNDLAVSAAWPIYNEVGNLEGVLGTHLLLSDINTYLKETVDQHNGIAFIIEKASGELVANSMNLPNFTVLPDGTLKRYKLEDVEDIDIQYAYEQLIDNPMTQQVYSSINGKYFINARELTNGGLEWEIISAIPESLFMRSIYKTILWSVLIATLSIMLSVLCYSLFMNKYLKPIRSLLQVSKDFSAGDLTKRVEIMRNDELGNISKSFNRVADNMQSLIENLENRVQERTEELQKANLTLETNQDELRLILDSAAEAIYGIDLEGNCTFCNRSCLRMLGYNDQSELLGKNMHWQIHHTHKDGAPFSIEDCRIYTAFVEGENSHIDDEVFWRKDGTSFDVEYYSYPKIKNGEIIGAVITFMDISERKQKEAEIQYLSYYDTLTGLQNRRSFEENRILMDNPDNLPLSVIFGDINGLKMTNDIFGHRAGDELIKKAAEIIKQVCRENDMVARIGGDEFVILLPKTTEEKAEIILERIKSGFVDARVEAIKCSISLGLDTKTRPDQSLDEIIANAENTMYKDKTMNRKSINNAMIDTVIETLHSKSQREKKHSLAVSGMCAAIGSSLQLSEYQISNLTRAGYLHDIGKIVLDDLLTKKVLSEDELEKMRQHPVVGYRILNLFDDTVDLAEYVYSHHERWDGTGYPRGLKGEEIPLVSRIIAISETYDRVRNRGDSPLTERKIKALEVIKEGVERRFDPRIVEVFIRMMEEKEK